MDHALQREEILFNYTRALPDNKKSKYGRYYTPKKIVSLTISMVMPHIDEDSIVMDIAAGCGAFLDAFKNHKTIARDMDEEAVQMLKHLGFKDADLDNSLLNVNRQKYGLSPKDSLVIVGNPPYNDWTSKNKKRGKNAKEKFETPMDDDLKSNDLGISFLQAFCKLRADVVCVLHPLSYLIKKTNFKKLRSFADHYCLSAGVIFSSREFSDTGKTPFPLVATLYLKGRMDYTHIENFVFDVLDEDVKFQLKKIETIDGYIRKYPPKKSDQKESPIGLYMYNIRDTNSLLSSGNFTEKINFQRHITVNYEEFYKYAYLNCMKRYLDKDFLLGNLSPIVCENDLENNSCLRDVFIIDTLLNNRKISAFDINNPKSILHKFGLLDEYKEKQRILNNVRESLSPQNLEKSLKLCGYLNLAIRDTKTHLKDSKGQPLSSLLMERDLTKKKEPVKTKIAPYDCQREENDNRENITGDLSHKGENCRSGESRWCFQGAWENCQSRESRWCFQGAWENCRSGESRLCFQKTGERGFHLDENFLACLQEAVEWGFNPYAIFLDYLYKEEKESGNTEPLKEFIKDYFSKLKNKYLHP